MCNNTLSNLKYEVPKMLICKFMIMRKQGINDK